MKSMNEHLTDLGVELVRSQRISRPDNYSLVVLHHDGRLGTAVIERAPDDTILNIYYGSARNRIADIPNDIAFATVAPEESEVTS